MTLTVTGVCQVAGCGDWLDARVHDGWGVTDRPSGGPDVVGHAECIKDVFESEIHRMSIEDLEGAIWPSVVRVTLTCDGCQRPKELCGCP